VVRSSFITSFLSLIIFVVFIVVQSYCFKLYYGIDEYYLIRRFLRCSFSRFSVEFFVDFYAYHPMCFIPI
jgi:hypothetical protein